MKLILGSSSIFRQNQLKQFGITFDSVSPELDEDKIKNSDHSPYEISRELSLAKAQVILQQYPDAIIIGADQVLDFEGQIFSKPKTEEKAIEQLSKLQGKTHKLITSYALVSKDKQIVESVVSSMTMKALTQKQITNYVKRDQPLHSCGSYKLETLGIALFDKIDCPDHSAIIGLPLISLSKALTEFGIELL
ncbi:nucleoside triphosphate pyrophosphatase [Bacteriovorax sp. Seq25_V]|uniref:Maf family protein n=1 Tax=Bacteriovorax sp. Seq25_V TaxID=1201288 RepID=UPI00038A1B7A|nr:nucleoside triphosphate pyrophosphatase [Bacteriovorax sp. Seq25_V]EQC47675.1 septum formation protein Maf [Bacteriovorax sp. Seq25_V]